MGEKTHRCRNSEMYTQIDLHEHIHIAQRVKHLHIYNDTQAHNHIQTCTPANRPTPTAQTYNEANRDEFRNRGRQMDWHRENHCDKCTAIQ
jgi:hypothetical protein